MFPQNGDALHSTDSPHSHLEKGMNGFLKTEKLQSSETGPSHHTGFWLRLAAQVRFAETCCSPVHSHVRSASINPLPHCLSHSFTFDLCDNRSQKPCWLKLRQTVPRRHPKSILGKIWKTYFHKESVRMTEVGTCNWYSCFIEWGRSIIEHLCVCSCRAWV